MVPVFRGKMMNCWILGDLRGTVHHFGVPYLLYEYSMGRQGALMVRESQWFGGSRPKKKTCPVDFPLPNPLKPVMYDATLSIAVH